LFYVTYSNTPLLLAAEAIEVVVTSTAVLVRVIKEHG
jgi:hypothetical protein